MFFLFSRFLRSAPKVCAMLNRFIRVKNVLQMAVLVKSLAKLLIFSRLSFTSASLLEKFKSGMRKVYVCHEKSLSLLL